MRASQALPLNMWNTNITIQRRVGVAMKRNIATSFIGLVLLCQSATSVAASTSTADCLFDWADRTYPEIFAPTKSASQTLDIYYFRHYPNSGSYLGVDKNAQRLIYVGPLAAPAPLLDLGLVSQWLNTAGCATSPLANAGANQKVAVGSVVALDGSASSDGYGKTLKYTWTLTSKPNGSSAILSDATAARPTFTVDMAGSYAANLVVNDGVLNSMSSASLTIEAAPNTTPVANAGSSQQVRVGATVTLDASLSSDADNDKLTYKWTLSSKPAGSAATISSATSATSSLKLDVAGSFVATVVVNDGNVDSAPKTVTIVSISDLSQFFSKGVSSARSSINGYLQAGSSFSLSITNNSKDTFLLTKAELTSGTAVIGSTTAASSLSGGSLIAGESVGLSFTLARLTQDNGIVFTYYLTDPTTGTGFSVSNSFAETISWFPW